MDNHVLSVLMADNPWMKRGELGPWFREHLPERFIPRTATLDGAAGAHLVIGPRRAGKSSLVWHWLAHRQEPVLYINCEEPSLREWLRSPALVAADLRGEVGGVQRIFLEEAQHLESAGLTIKGLVDRLPESVVFVTGSSSFHLEAQTRESLAGRATRQLLLPLSLSEMGAQYGGLPPVVARLQQVELTERTAVFGGYPSVLRGEEPDLELARLVESFVVRDASDRFRIGSISAFKKTMELIASQVGQLCNFSEWSSIVGVGRALVRDYIQILEDTHIVNLVPPYVGGARSELTGMPKIYFLDNGLRNRLFGGFAPLSGRADKGALVENLAFTEIAKSINPLLDTIRFWRSKGGAEVDFIVEHGGQILPIEVKAGESHRNVTRSLRSFIDAYRPPRVLLASVSGASQQEVEGTLVQEVPLHELAGEVRRFVEEPRGG